MEAKVDPSIDAVAKSAALVASLEVLLSVYVLVSICNVKPSKAGVMFASAGSIIKLPVISRTVPLNVRLLSAVIEKLENGDTAQNHVADKVTDDKVKADN